MPDRHEAADPGLGLSGAIITTAQLMDVALLIAENLGIIVDPL